MTPATSVVTITKQNNPFKHYGRLAFNQDGTDPKVTAKEIHNLFRQVGNHLSILWDAVADQGFPTNSARLTETVTTKSPSSTIPTNGSTPSPTLAEYLKEGKLWVGNDVKTAFIGKLRDSNSFRQELVAFAAKLQPMEVQVVTDSSDIDTYTFKSLLSGAIPLIDQTKKTNFANQLVGQACKNIVPGKVTEFVMRLNNLRASQISS